MSHVSVLCVILDTARKMVINNVRKRFAKLDLKKIKQTKRKTKITSIKYIKVIYSTF